MISNISKTSSFLVKNIFMKNISKVEVCHKQKFGLIGKLLNVKNKVITFSLNGKEASFESENIFSLVEKALKGSNKTEWFKEETVSILSSEVNKVIDAACEKYGKSIDKKEKESIFRKISSDITPIKLDPKCTQSSISHIIYNSEHFIKQTENLSFFSQSLDEKNKLRNMVNSRLTDLVFIKKFGGIDLNLLRQKTAKEVELRIKLK